MRSMAQMAKPEAQTSGFVHLAAKTTSAEDVAAGDWSFDQVDGTVQWVNHVSGETGNVPLAADHGFAGCMKVIGHGGRSLQIDGFVVGLLPAVWVQHGLDQLAGTESATVGLWRWERTGTRWRCWGMRGRPATSEDAAALLMWAAAEFLSTFDLYRAAGLGSEAQRDWSRLTHLSATYFSACTLTAERSVHGVVLHAFREYLRALERDDPDHYELFRTFHDLVIPHLGR